MWGWKLCKPADTAEKSESAEKPFRRERKAAWADKVDSWPWVARGGETLAKSGPCERCGHSITFVDATAVYAGFSEDNLQPIETSSRRYAACNCGVTHPETPEGEIGCGANGLIERG